MSRPVLARAAAATLSALLAFGPAIAQPQRKAAPPPPPSVEEPLPPQPAAPPPYDAQLMRLAELLGALHHLRTVCGASDADVWRDRMAALIEADQPTPERRDRLAGAFNASFRTWARSYRSCTPSAGTAIQRFLAEAAKIASDVRVPIRSVNDELRVFRFALTLFSGIVAASASKRLESRCRLKDAHDARRFEYRRRH